MFLLNLRRRFVLKVVILFECPIVGGKLTCPPFHVDMILLEEGVSAWTEPLGGVFG